MNGSSDASAKERNTERQCPAMIGNIPVLEYDPASAGGPPAPRPALLAPEHFSDEVPGPRRVADPAHHPLIRKVLIATTVGAGVRPTPEQFHRAMAATKAGPVERDVLGAWLEGASTRELVRCWMDGAYSLRALVRAMLAYASENESVVNDPKVAIARQTLLGQWRVAHLT